MTGNDSGALVLCWHAPSVARAPALRCALADALAPLAIELEDAESGGSDPGPPTPGLLVLSTFEDADFAQVARLSHDGERRLIVAVAGEAPNAVDHDWRLLALGASEVCRWRELLDHAAAIEARLLRWREIDGVLASPLIRNNLIGASPAWTSLLRRLIEVARFTNIPILLLGESGTGKELLARLVHTLDQRPGKRELVLLDCTTVSPELSGSEFFGHERGAFTNAHSARDGAFALADSGTLFLDEVGELPAPLQAQLLRVVQEKSYKRLGSNTWRQTDFRLICATNRDLWSEIGAGVFRRDLYYRLAGWVFQVPSLHERRADILALARHFLRLARAELGSVAIAPPVAAWLQSRDYPGNIRDLHQLMLRIAARHVGDGPIGLADIPEDERPPCSVASSVWPNTQLDTLIEGAVAAGFGLREITRGAGEAAIRTALRTHPSLREAARSLGVTERALQLRRASDNHGRPLVH